MSITPIQSAPAFTVHIGRRPGVYTAWSKVQDQITDFPLAWYRSYNSLSDAKEFYKLWKIRQKQSIHQLMSQSLKRPVAQNVNKERSKIACVKWCARMNKIYSVDIVRTIVDIAKLNSTSLTVKDLKAAHLKFKDMPPWDLG